MASKVYKKKRTSFVDRLVMGKEKSEGFARASLPSNRWELFWDIFKSKFWRLVLTDLLILLFMLPVFGVIFLRYVLNINYGTLYPFAQGFGVAYQAPTSVIGFAEQIAINVNGFAFLLLPIAFFVGAVGISGGVYVIRNMVWTEGVFVANDFWQGIKKNYKNVLLTTLLFSLCFYLFISAFGACNLQLALKVGPAWLFKTAKVMLIVFLIFVSICALHMIAINANYEVKFWHLIKNGALFTVGLLPFNVFFGALCMIPYAITLLGGFLGFIGYIITFGVGLSLLLLIWLSYEQWVFDRYINPKIGAKSNRGIYEKVKSESNEKLKAYSEQMQIFVGTGYAQRPVKPITDDELKLSDLPEGYSRADIEKLNESRRAITEDHEKYVKEHQAEIQVNADEEKMRLERERRIEKAKRELSKRKRNNQ